MQPELRCQLVLQEPSLSLIGVRELREQTSEVIRRVREDRAAPYTLTYFHLPERKRSVKSTARPIKSIPIASQMPVSARRGPSQ